MDVLIRKIEELKKEAQKLKNKEESDRRNSPHSRGIKRDSPNDFTPAGSLPKIFQGSTSVGNICQADFEGDGDGDWVSAFRAEAGQWKGDKLVVLSLFDGIGGIWAALSRLGVPFTGYSSEVSDAAIQVVKTRYPQVKHVGDVRKLDLQSISEKVDLVVGGFPCQDLSIMGKKEGLHGSRSKLFFDLLRVLQIFKPRWFLVENVMSMSWIDRDEISRHLKVPPIELDSQEITASKRKRLYWTNIPYPPRLPRLRDHPSTSLQCCLQNATALEQKAGVILCSNHYTGGTARVELVLRAGTKSLRYINHKEVELLMGYPSDYTLVTVRDIDNSLQATKSHKKSKDIAASSPLSKVITGEASPGIEKQNTPPRSGRLRQNRVTRTFFDPPSWTQKQRVQKDSLKDNIRWELLGNSFSVPVISYLTSPLLKYAVRAHNKPVHITGSVKETELSAMEPDDSDENGGECDTERQALPVENLLWALFNQHGRPNWYALIFSRTGDRFSKVPDAGRKRNVTKTPLHIEMRYLEMTAPYLETEEDEWNPARGSGLLALRDEVDIQDSWLAFSHRVTSFVKFENKFFVYPGKDEVWAVTCWDTRSRYFVYVEGSTIDVQKLESATPGHEGFYARCLILQKTAEHETYRKSDIEVEFTDLQPFNFRVPFHFKQEATLLKVEVGGVTSRKSMAFDREARGKRKYKRKRGDDDDDDDDDDGDDDDDSGDDPLGEEVDVQADTCIEDVEMEQAIVSLAEDNARAGAVDENDAGSGQGSGASTLDA